MFGLSNSPISLNSISVINMKVIIYLLVLLLACPSLGKITLQELKKTSPGDLADGQMVEVFHSSSTTDHHQAERSYFVIKVANRNKRTAYDTMNNLINRVVKTLTTYKLIPDENSLVQSKTKPQYLSKKRQWSFSTIFVILGSQKEIKQVHIQFKKYGIQKLNAKPSIHFLNQKTRALQVFAGAKAKLQKALQKFPGFRIEQIESIDIDGENLPNSDLIQKQIEEQFSDSEQNMEESKLMDEEEESQQTKSIINLKVLFEVTDRPQEEDASEQDPMLPDDDSDDSVDDETEEQEEEESQDI